MKVLVAGEVSVSAYKDKHGEPAASLELTAKDFQFLDSRGASGDSGESGAQDARAADR